MTEPTIEIVRDVRIDHLGFVGELADHFEKKIKPMVKTHLVGKSACRAEADFFTATLSGGSYRTVDVDMLLYMYDSKQISRKDLLLSISATIKPLEQFLTQRQIGGICTTSASSPALKIRRKEGVEFTLVDAVKSLGTSFDR